MSLFPEHLAAAQAHQLVPQAGLVPVADPAIDDHRPPVRNTQSEVVVHPCPFVASAGRLEHAMKGRHLGYLFLLVAVLRLLYGSGWFR
jgi:hypothetical protein